jgi:hypothetical protein
MKLPAVLQIISHVWRTMDEGRIKERSIHGCVGSITIFNPVGPAPSDRVPNLHCKKNSGRETVKMDLTFLIHMLATILKLKSVAKVVQKAAFLSVFEQFLAAEWRRAKFYNP